MKILKISTLFFLSVLIGGVMSCSSDDDDNGSANAFTFDGISYTMVDGVVEDYGASAPSISGGDDSHYNFDFTISDDVMTPSGAYFGSETTFAVYVELFAPSTTEFQTGTFNYMDGETSDALDINGQFFFSAAEVIVVSGVVDGSVNGTEYQVTGGSVTVSGSSATSYIVEYDLNIAGGKTLTGTYSAGFQFITN